MRSFGSEGGARVEQPDAVALELDAHLKQLGVGELWELVDALERRGHEGVLVLAAHGGKTNTRQRAGELGNPTNGAGKKNAANMAAHTRG